MTLDKTINYTWVPGTYSITYWQKTNGVWGYHTQARWVDDPWMYRLPAFQDRRPLVYLSFSRLGEAPTLQAAMASRR